MYWKCRFCWSPSGENHGIFSTYEFQSNTDAHGLQIHFEKEVKQFPNLLKKKKKKKPWREESLGENGYVYMYGWIPSLFTWNYHKNVC